MHNMGWETQGEGTNGAGTGGAAGATTDGELRHLIKPHSSGPIQNASTQSAHPGDAADAALTAERCCVERDTS